MSKKSYGGPAFPSNGNFLFHGMNLRDWFAGQALAGWMADPKSSPENKEGIALSCYELADAMMAARNKTPEKLETSEDIKKFAAKILEENGDQFDALHPVKKKKGTVK